MIESSLGRLIDFCEKEKYLGWDPFDGLNSDVFHILPFKQSNLFRLIWLQFFKRSPINLRTFAMIRKEYNAKGLALFVSGLILLEKIKEVESLLTLLPKVECSGYSGKSWGYNFPWQARAFYVPFGKPNIITTLFVGNAFLDHFSKTGIEKSLQNAVSTCTFILENLVLFENENTLFFAYIPGETARINNANMLAAAFLARVFSLTNEHLYYVKSKKAIKYSMKALSSDYSWPYGELPHHQFIDNFHTGYNLVALSDWMKFTNERIWAKELKHAFKYFLDTFWLEDGCPKYYHDSLYPIDIHCSAQGIITCLKLKDYDHRSVPIAKKIAKWAINNMQDKKGYFYYQKTRWYTNKIPYMRWSQAWMFYALSKLSHECHELTRIIPDKNLKKISGGIII